VNDWARQLFPRGVSLSVPLQNKIREIDKSQVAASDKIKAALQFVQDDIRYMGFEMGENSHRPADPSRVFAQRFGDCKEKSYLLCCMLNKMGIEAEPVLINTDRKKNIDNYLPAPNAFNHVTVRVQLGNASYWFDPTISYQRGSIENIFYPDYQAGLVISDTTNSLTTIPFRNISRTNVKEYFKVSSMQGGGTLAVTTTYRGTDADNARSSFNSQSISELMNTFQKFYAAFYEDIKADSLSFIDNDSTGVFVTNEYYHIPKFWTVDKSKVSRFSISAFIINSVLRKPKERDRTMPFSLSFPARYTEDVVVELPQNWKVTEDETHIKNKSYSFDSKFYNEYNRVYLETDYQNFSDHTNAEEAAEYFKGITEYEEVASFYLSYGSEEKTSDRSRIPALILLGAVLAAVLFGVIRGRLRRSRKRF
jgi:hypothetical protein